MRFLSKTKNQLFQPSTTKKAILFQLFQPKFSKTPFFQLSQLFQSLQPPCFHFLSIRYYVLCYNLSVLSMLRYRFKVVFQLQFFGMNSIMQRFIISEDFHWNVCGFEFGISTLSDKANVSVEDYWELPVRYILIAKKLN